MFTSTGRLREVSFCTKVRGDERKTSVGVSVTASQHIYDACTLGSQSSLARHPRSHALTLLLFFVLHCVLPHEFRAKQRLLAVL